MAAPPFSKASANIAGLSAHARSPTRMAAVAALFAALYALALPEFVGTMGEPLKLAIEHAQKLKANATIDVFAAAPLESVVSLDDDDDSSGVVAFGGAAELVFDDSDAVKSTAASQTASGSSSSSSSASATPKNKTSPRPLLVEEPEDTRLPSRFLPNAIPLFFMCLVAGLNFLYFLLCRWSVWFKTTTQFEPCHLQPGAFMYVQPKENRGIPALVLITVNSDSGRLEFTFQRQLYEIMPPTASPEDPICGFNMEDQAAEQLCREIGYVRVVLARIDLPVAEYAASRGLETKEVVEAQFRKFGPNTLSVPQPPFAELLQAQLLMPLSVFQVFSALLWAIDEYIQFTLFTLFTIVMMESATAFQRHRTMVQLKGLSPKPFLIMTKRYGEWVKVSSGELLPGDLISLCLGDKSNPETFHDLVPCDVIILQGSAIVNEATLTGESVPQMKEALSVDPPRNLSVDGADRMHMLFSGTTLVAVRPGGDTPDGGCLCRVLRTGFGSSQGELMQMIEYSQKAVSADNWETALSLGILLVFGVTSATYGFIEGTKKGTRTQHDLLLRAIMTVTAVVPRQLPVMMTLQVNHALMALMKEGVLCTEPYRVPTAGKVTHCLFDKTGTLTSDELVPSGVCSNEGGLVRLPDASTDAQLVLACCHSLVSLPDEADKLLGDPIELAAVRELQWRYDANTSMCTPGDVTGKEKQLGEIMERLKAANGGDVQNPTPKGSEGLVKSLRDEADAVVKSMQAIKTRAQNSPIIQVEIVKRYHFDAALQRMSVVVRVHWKGSKELGGSVCLVKGSPEMLRPLLASVPDWYEAKYRELAEQGKRVLALAMRPVRSEEGSGKYEELKRAQAESRLTFVGFVAFECKTRADSPAVIAALRNAAIKTAMVTGDAPLTALSVARECNFLQGAKPALALDKETLCWRGALTKDAGIEVACDLASPDAGMSALVAQGHDLVVTEQALDRLVTQSDGRAWAGVGQVAVFARMSPQGKARVIKAVQAQGVVLMCGDGGNDVGALKQADVGLALLSGYGSANTLKGAPGAPAQGLVLAGGEAKAEDALNEQVEEERRRLAKFSKLKKQALELKRQELAKLQQQWIQEEVAKLPPDAGMFGQFSAVKTAAMRMNAELMKESALLDAKYGGMASAPASQDPLAALDEAPGGMPVVRPGDASVAAPFTSRVPSVRSVVLLIRQGRSTLLGALQQHQTMMIECVMHAYTHALISLEGSRSSERQLMVSGWLIMAASVAFSYGTPAEKMHPCRPLNTVFHPAIALSIAGQCVIHLFALSVATQMAKTAMGPELIAQVVAFQKKVSAGTLKAEETMDDEDPLKALQAMWGQPFMPNLLNTTVFLVETAQMVAVMLVNYKGRPFTKGIMENHVLFMSLVSTVAWVVFTAWEVNPQINAALHFHAFPDDAFRFAVLGLLSAVLVGTFIWDRLCVYFFAPDVFYASLESAKQTSLKDLVPVVWTLVRVVVGFLVLASANPLIWGAAYYGNKRLSEWMEEEEEKKRQLERRAGGRGVV